MTLSTRGDIVLARRWLAIRLRLLLRSRRTALFTFVFPLFFLVILNAASGNGELKTAGGNVRFSQFFTPGIGIFAVTMSCYTGLIYTFATAREEGVLKRVRSTPLPSGIYLAAMIGAVVIGGIASVVLMFAVAVPAFGVQIYPRLLPAAFVTLVVGASAVAAVALAVGGFVQKAESAPTVANLTLMPVIFISGIFYPVEGAPLIVRVIAHLLPLSHFAEAFEVCFSPNTRGSGFRPLDLAVMAWWGFVGLRIAMRRFRWEPVQG